MKIIFLPSMSKETEASRERYRKSIMNFTVPGEMELVHVIRTSTTKHSKRMLPINKTEAEVDRMWEYNKMMGRV